MGLTLSGAAVNEKRVIAGSRVLSYFYSGSISQTIEIADNKAIERVLWIESILRSFGACPAVGLMGQGACRWLFVIVNLELHIDILAHNGNQSLPHQGIKAPGQPFSDKNVGDTDDEDTVVVA